MIYILGEPPQWLINVIREFGEEIVKVNDCNVPPRSIIISVDSTCMVRGSIVLSLLPYKGAIPIQRGTARGILSTVISTMKRIGNVKSIDEALALLNFARTKVISAVNMMEIMLEYQVAPGAVYTIAVLNNDKSKCTVALGRGTSRGTLVLESSISWLLSNGSDMYVVRGDLVLELMALSMVFGINFVHSNPPY
ncbi:hypothetical protein [Vulcanisaeta distributa]|uniref:hypothetical protein n=1 Tax=Vulcanisaeta distributa TaxID=164451 RepID=UPI0011E532C2|nr:hypothetical protein [Vulcanisaeta distributa]